MTDSTYLEIAAAILHKELTAWNQRAAENPEDMRAEILDARLRIAEGFARLAAASPAAPSVTPGALTARVEDALFLATRAAAAGGAHDKTWIIDQMVRTLTGCGPAGESDWYLRFVREAGEWDGGTAP
jgi:hypothetical protein